MKDIYVCGELGMAIYTEDGAQYVITQNEEPVESNYWRNVIVCGTGKYKYQYKKIDIPNITLTELYGLLEKESDIFLAVRNIVTGMDTEMHEETRRSCIESAEILMASDEIHDSVKHVFLSRPLPEEADPKGALEYCNVNYYKVRGIYEELYSR